MTGFTSRWIALFCLLLAGFAAAGRAQAQDAPLEIAGLPITPQSIQHLPDQRRLSSNDVVRALNSYPAVRGFADSHADEWNGYRVNPQSDDPIRDIRAKLTADGSLSEFEKIVSRFGFQGFDDWTRTAFSIAAAFGFDKTPLAAAKSLSPVTREMMFAQMPGLRMIYNKLEPPQENVQVVAPFAAQIEQIIAAK